MPIDVAKRAHVAAEFAEAKGVVGPAPEKPDDARFLFAWLAGMTYLETHTQAGVDLLEVDPRQAFDPFVTEDYRFGDRSWRAEDFWERLALDQTIYAEEDYLRALGFDSDPSILPHRERALERLVDLRIFGGVPGPEIEECVALGDGRIWGCSGVLVAKSEKKAAVLSAKHCDDSHAERRWALFGPSVNAKTECHKTKEPAIRHPNLDIALYLLDTPPQMATPAKLATSEMIGEVDEVLIAGFGFTDLTATGAAGKLRKAKVGVATRICDKNSHAKYGCEDGEMVLGKRLNEAVDAAGGPCPGDSGGPGYVLQGKDEKRCLVSIISRPAKGPRTICGDASIHVRVDLLHDWIRKGLEKWDRDLSVDICS